jgi:hypothetical protein
MLTGKLIRGSGIYNKKLSSLFTFKAIKKYVYEFKNDMGKFRCQ